MESDTMHEHIVTREKKSGECLKTDINNLLWQWMPDYTTLAEAEAIAVKVYDLITGDHR